MDFSEEVSKNLSRVLRGNDKHVDYSRLMSNDLYMGLSALSEILGIGEDVILKVAQHSEKRGKNRFEFRDDAGGWSVKARKKHSLQLLKMMMGREPQGQRSPRPPPRPPPTEPPPPIVEHSGEVPNSLPQPSMWSALSGYNAEASNSRRVTHASNRFPQTSMRMPESSSQSPQPIVSDSPLQSHFSEKENLSLVCGSSSAPPIRDRESSQDLSPTQTAQSNDGQTCGQFHFAEQTHWILPPLEHSLEQPVDEHGSMIAESTREESMEQVSKGQDVTLDVFSQTSVVWEKYLNEDGCPWWWCPATQEHFMESSSAPWQKHVDEVEGKYYWSKDEDDWFWEHTGTKSILHPPPLASDTVSQTHFSEKEHIAEESTDKDLETMETASPSLDEYTEYIDPASGHFYLFKDPTNWFWSNKACETTS